MPPSPRRPPLRTAASCPTSENWAGVEASNVLQDMLTEIAQGGDIASAAATADAAIEVAAQRLDSRTSNHQTPHHHRRTVPMASDCDARTSWTTTRSPRAVVHGRARTTGSKRRRRSSALPYGLLLPSIAVMVVMLGYPLYRLVRAVDCTSSGSSRSSVSRRRGSDSTTSARSCPSATSGPSCGAR